MMFGGSVEERLQQLCCLSVIPRNHCLKYIQNDVLRICRRASAAIMLSFCDTTQSLPKRAMFFSFLFSIVFLSFLWCSCDSQVDVQGDDVLMQIFTSTVLQKKPGTEAPFLEFIQRLCAAPKPGGASSQIRPGCGGFGIRNFLTLFLSIEVRCCWLPCHIVVARSCAAWRVV